MRKLALEGGLLRAAAYVSLVIVGILWLNPSSRAFAEVANTDVPYRDFSKVFPLFGHQIPSRVAIWVVAQLHLYLAAFVLAVPIFALIIEYIGYKTGDKKYDRLAYEFTKLLSVSFSLTATLGAVLTFMLIVLYPKFTTYFTSIFGPTFFYYVLLFFAEAGFLYSYYYGWGKFSPRKHLLLGVGLNVVGTLIMFIANGWVTFMTSPAGIDKAGMLVTAADPAQSIIWFGVDISQLIADVTRLPIGVVYATMNFTWMPINIHRIIANVAFGGSIAGAYGAYKYLGARTAEERAHYDWMGYIGNFVAISAFLPLPFAGYWLGREIYAFSQGLGMVLMGGAFSWLFIIQAILIGMLFLSANLYLWFGMGRIPGAERFRGFIKYILIVVMICFGVWATPSSMQATAAEIQAMGGSHHPILKFLGVMSAKNTAVNMLILSTYISFLLYRRGNKELIEDRSQKSSIPQFLLLASGVVFIGWMARYCFRLLHLLRLEELTPTPGNIWLSYAGTAILGGIAVALVVQFVRSRTRHPERQVSWFSFGNTAQFLIFAAAIFFVIFIGIYGYKVPTKVRISMSVPQVLSVLLTMILVTVADVAMFRHARVRGEIEWGKMRAASQYCLFFTAITFTWLMGLMGYVRSGLRQHWHVYLVMKDTSSDAFTPTLGYASSVVSVTVMIFFALVAFIFWLAGLSGKKSVDASGALEDEH